MIESFADRRLKRFFLSGDRSRIAPELAGRINQILTALDLALTIEELNLTSFRLHPLKGELKGFFAVTVRANWRIIFRFEDGMATAIELIDYH